MKKKLKYKGWRMINWKRGLLRYYFLFTLGKLLFLVYTGFYMIFFLLSQRSNLYSLKLFEKSKHIDVKD